MRYRIRFLNLSLDAICEMTADARSSAGAIVLVSGIQWPLGAKILQIVDVDSREIYRISKSQIR